MTGWTVDFKPSSKRAKALLQYTKTRGRDDYDDMKKLDMQMTAANISKALTALHETPKGTALHETQKGTALHDTEENGLARDTENGLARDTEGNGLARDTEGVCCPSNRKSDGRQ